MYQHRSYWNKSLKHRHLWRSMYVNGNLRLRQLVKVNINPWLLMCKGIDMTQEEIDGHLAIMERQKKTEVEQ